MQVSFRFFVVYALKIQWQCEHKLAPIWKFLKCQACIQNTLQLVYNSYHFIHDMFKYVVLQKSNETDFLLTMNFVLFTNQGYPLQNSSLWQLHGDEGVVSIVRSSACRLLLVYLSARRLLSSGYYPKYQNGALSSGF